jgi:predicted O-methyltransferase YrrM
MMLRDLLAHPPRLHEADGRPTTYRLADDVLTYIDAHVGASSRTLETGAGVSTVVFAMKGGTHTCVVPDGAQVERITRYCDEHAVSTARVTFEIAASERVLPHLALQGLDLVLIDGCHGFPAPFIDWYYTASALKTGGLLIVDDTHLWTGHVLREFLRAEPGWRHERDFTSRAAVFRKLTDGDVLKEWTHQPYTVRHSRGSVAARTRRALEHLARGELATLAKKLRHTGR